MSNFVEMGVAMAINAAVMEGLEPAGLTLKRRDYEDLFCELKATGRIAAPSAPPWIDMHLSGLAVRIRPADPDEP